MGAIVSALGTLLAKVLGDNLLRWVAVKAALLFLFVFVLPVVFNNFLGDLLTGVFGLVNEKASALNVGGINPVVALTGLAAWIGERLQLTQCASVIMSALLVKVTLQQIPFFKF